MASGQSLSAEELREYEIMSYLHDAMVSVRAAMKFALDAMNDVQNVRLPEYRKTAMTSVEACMKTAEEVINKATQNMSEPKQTRPGITSAHIAKICANATFQHAEIALEAVKEVLKLLDGKHMPVLLCVPATTIHVKHAVVEAETTLKQVQTALQQFRDQSFHHLQESIVMEIKLNKRQGMNIINYLHHATPRDLADLIIRENQYYFIGNPSHDIQSAPLASMDIKGVWFCPTLYQEALPTQSPYGQKLLAVPINSMFTQNSKLYLEHLHYTTKHETYVQYVRLILVNPELTNMDPNFVPPGCMPIDITNNKFLCLDLDYGSKLKTISNTGVCSPKIYVDVFVVADRLLVSKGPVHDVKWTGRAQMQPKSGIEPGLSAHLADLVWQMKSAS